MRDKAVAAAALVEWRLPFFTREVRALLSKINRGSPPNPSPAAVLKLIKEKPDHFADLIRKKTDNFRLRGHVVWENADTGNTFDDIDIEFVCRYLRVSYQLEDYLINALPHRHFIEKYQRFLSEKHARDEAEGRRQDAERFYCFPETLASNECLRYWKELSILSPDECAALALGRDPDTVSQARVEEAVGDGKSVFLEEYRRIKRFFERRTSSKVGRGDKVEFKYLLAWMRENPAKHLMGSVWMGAPARPSEAARDDKASTVHSLYKICMALALKQYPDLLERIKYDTLSDKDPKGSLYGQMERDLRPIIPKLNDGTLKVHLRAAYSYVRGEELLAPIRATDGNRKIPEK